MSENIIMLKIFLTAFTMILIVASRYMLDDYSLIRITIDGLIALMLCCYIWSVV